jgi:hypothetical protein
VRLRGWPVPYIGLNELQRGRDLVGQDVDGLATGHFDAWRFFVSGQFNELRAVSPTGGLEAWRRAIQSISTLNL